MRDYVMHMRVGNFATGGPGERYIAKGGATVVMRYDPEGDCFYAGTALCHERDNYDKSLGRIIAGGRLEKEPQIIRVGHAGDGKFTATQLRAVAERAITTFAYSVFEDEDDAIDALFNVNAFYILHMFSGIISSDLSSDEIAPQLKTMEDAIAHLGHDGVECWEANTATDAEELVPFINAVKNRMEPSVAHALYTGQPDGEDF